LQYGKHSKILENKINSIKEFRLLRECSPIIENNSFLFFNSFYKKILTNNLIFLRNKNNLIATIPYNLYNLKNTHVDNINIIDNLDLYE